MNSSHNKMEKVSIRFFNDREVRAVWDEMLSNGDKKRCLS